MKVTVTGKGMDGLRKGIETLKSTKILVGIPQENNKTRSGGITTVDLAYIHEHGSPAKGIPARPFMKKGIENSRDLISEMMEEIAVYNSV